MSTRTSPRRKANSRNNSQDPITLSSDDENNNNRNNAIDETLQQPSVDYPGTARRSLRKRVGTRTYDLKKLLALDAPLIDDDGGLIDYSESYSDTDDRESQRLAESLSKMQQSNSVKKSVNKLGTSGTNKKSNSIVIKEPPKSTRSTTKRRRTSSKKQLQHSFIVQFKYDRSKPNSPNFDSRKPTLIIRPSTPSSSGLPILRVKPPSQSANIVTQPEVNQEELELPYRGLYSFKDANTYHTRPNRRFKERFRKFMRQGAKLTTQHSDATLVKQLTAEEQQLQREYELQTLTVSKMRCVHFRGFEIDTWYKSPYPQEYSSRYVLHLCEYCLQYFNSSFKLQRHELKCQYLSHPPGNEIYRDGKLSMFEIDGRKNVIYCQNLCLFAKLFLNSKTLYYDVEPFMFYVLCETVVNYKGELIYHFVGYFSKEKLNGTGYNLSCILTLPIYQRKGYGNFLIDFSYLLSKREFRLGTPEKPLSDLGLLSYRNYWRISVAKALKSILSLDPLPSSVSIDDIANLTGMIHNDVIVGLEQLHGLVFDPITGRYGITINVEIVEEVLAKWERKNYMKVQPDKLVWKPVILGPSGGINTTSTMVITTEDSSETQNDKEAGDSAKQKADGALLASSNSTLIPAHDVSKTSAQLGTSADNSSAVPLQENKVVEITETVELKNNDTTAIFQSALPNTNTASIDKHPLTEVTGSSKPVDELSDANGTTSKKNAENHDHTANNDSQQNLDDASEHMSNDKLKSSTMNTESSTTVEEKNERDTVQSVLAEDQSTNSSNGVETKNETPGADAVLTTINEQIEASVDIQKNVKQAGSSASVDGHAGAVLSKGPSSSDVVESNGKTEVKKSSTAESTQPDDCETSAQHNNEEIQPANPTHNNLDTKALPSVLSSVSTLITTNSRDGVSATEEVNSKDDDTVQSVPKYDEKGNKLMSSVSLILNFMQDDLEDDRDLEVQTLEKIQLDDQKLKEEKYKLNSVQKSSDTPIDSNQKTSASEGVDTTSLKEHQVISTVTTESKFSTGADDATSTGVVAISKITESTTVTENVSKVTNSNSNNNGAGQLSDKALVCFPGMFEDGMFSHINEPVDVISLDSPPNPAFDIDVNPRSRSKKAKNKKKNKADTSIVTMDDIDILLDDEDSDESFSDNEDGDYDVESEDNDDYEDDFQTRFS
ncbi:unnamed protein product [Ambrosiozyma monospora]|uniref:Unnamed protein product n=1 Tax=Ambrosiozyma monospora TaxID=43982 RepID=A0ACB5SY63_AMBMO|nr:unnamed protein product [Ambrosiozyma monospora]